MAVSPRQRRLSVIVDGGAIRRLRDERGMSQERLASLCCISKRTIQRAERGMTIARETAAFLAEALKVKPDALRLSATTAKRAGAVRARDDVILVPSTSGRRIVDAIRFSFRTEIAFEVEPTTENADLISELAAWLRRVQPDPWRPPWENPFPSELEVLRIQAQVNKCLSALLPLGVRVFLATYTADCVRPYLGDEGFMIADDDQPSDPAEVALVVVSDSTTRHLVRRPCDIRVEPADSAT